MVASRRQIAVFAFFLAVAASTFPTLATAATADFRVLIDIDNSSSTGCSEGGVAGVEQLFVTRVVTTDTSAQVTRTYRQVCSAGVFGAPIDLDLTTRPAGFRTPSGAVLSESRIPFSAVGGDVPHNLHLAFDATDGFSTQHVLTQPNGVRILYPSTAIARRHAVSNPGTARTMVLDGLATDWDGIEPLVKGIANDGTVAVRILKIYAFANTADDFLYFRFDGFIDNSNPYAQDDTYARKPGEGLSIPAPGVLANDGDPTGHPLTASPVSPAEHGDVTLNPDGSFTYAPDDPTSLNSDKFDYKASNGTKESNVARVTIKVSSHPSAAPVAVDDAYSTPEDTTLNVAAPGVLGNDVDSDGPSLSATLLTNPAHGSVVLSGNGAFTYTPATNFNGTDTFTYRVSDGTNTDDALVTITISPVNDAPVAQNISRTTNEEVPVSVTLQAADAEPGALAYAVVSGPSNGVLSGSAPNLTYTPNPDFFGTDTFTYRATDGGGKVSNTATVTITVNPVNDAPSFTCGPNVLADSGLGAASFPNWATNISAGPSNESSQTLTFEITANTNTALFSVQPAVSSNGTLTFTPLAGVTGSANITIRLRDNGGIANGGVDVSASCSFTISLDASPTVTSSTPTNGATGVPTNTTITVNFSEPVTATTSSFTLECPTGAPQTFTVGGSGTNAITLTPSSLLPNGTTCTVTVIASQISDTDANDPPNNMAANASFSFTTDFAPTVTTTTPTNGATGVATNAPITINFSEPVTATTSSFTIECPAPGSLQAFTVGGSGTSTLTLTPSSLLPNATTCTVTILGAQVSDVDANDPPDTMVTNYVFAFTTDAPPAVTTTTPADTATAVATNTAITINFTEAVNATTSSFTIECPAPGNLQTFTVSGSGTSAVTLTPSSLLPNGTTCTVTVLANQISDTDANDPPDNMLANSVFTFTTDAPPSVTTTVPANASSAATTTTITVNFDEAVNATTSSFTIECPAPGNLQAFTVGGSGTSTITLTPTSALPGGVTCTVTVIASQISDADAGDPPDNMLANYVFSFDVDATPTVTSTTPTNGAAQVAANTDVTINFSEPVNASGASFTISCASSGSHTFTTSASPDTSFTLNPTSDFTQGEVCTVTVVAANVTDVDANDPPDNMAADYVFTFTVDAAPSVTSTTPTNGATDIGAATNITVNFDESVNATTSSFTISCTSSGSHTFTLSSSPNAAFTLNPDSDFTQGETCTVTALAAQITDADVVDPPDNMLANYVFSFTIDAAPSVNAVTPTNGSTNVATNTNLSVTFSEPVTITNTSLTISCANSGAHTVTVSGGATTWTVNPDTDFSNGELCTATVIAAGVSDNDANDPPDNMLANFVWSFTTDNPPSVASTTPTNGSTTFPSTDVTVTFDEAVNAAASSFTISCTSTGAHTFVLTGGPTTFTLNPDSDFTGGETCTVTVVAANVTDQDAGDPPDNMVSDYVFSFLVDAAPTVTSTTPTNGAPQVASNTDVTINFSESVNASGSSFTISCGTSGSHTFTTSASPNSSFTLNPNVDFTPGETCTVTVVAANVTDADANDPPDNMAADYVFTFTVDSAPSVSATTPTDTASNQASNTNVTITFTEAVNATTSSFTISCGSSGSHTFALSGGPATWTLNPDTDFTQGETCTVTALAAQITDSDAFDPPDNMAADYVFSFSIDAAPSVTSTTPSDLATQQANNTDVTVTFNESVNASASSFTISCATSGAHTYALSGGPTTWTLNPDTDFTNGELCTVTVVAAQVTDTDTNDPPNNMLADSVFTFTVDTPPSVTTTTPAEGGVITPSSTITINFDESVNATTSSFTINCGGAQAYTLSASPSSSFTLTPSSNLPTGSCTLTVVAAQITDADAGDPPDNMVSDVTVNFTVNTPPNAIDDSANAIGNLTKTVADGSGVLANDSDPDPGNTISIIPANQGPLTGSAGGTITFTSGGGYTYHSQAGDANVDDLFTYTVSDNNGATDTATLTIHVGSRYIFVDDTGVAGDGRDISPFNTLQTAEAGSAANDTLVIKQGSYTDFITLKSGQIMYGDGATTTLSTTFNAESFTILVPSGTHPALKRSTAGNTITLSSNNTLSGIDVSASSGGAAIAGTNFGTLTANENTRIGVSTTNPAGALNLDTGTLAATFPTVNSSGGTNGILLTNCAGTLTVQGGTLTGATGDEFSSTGANPSVNVTFSGNITYAGTGNAINVSGTAGVNTGNITFDTGTLTVTGGTAINVVAATGTLNFYTTTGTAAISGAAGVNLGVNANGTYNFGRSASPASFAITDTAGTCFNIGNNPAAKVTYSGNMSQANAAALINVVSLNASGNMTFQSGTLNATAGTGVTLSDTDGPVTFAGTMNLSGTAGVLINKGTGGTINFGANTTITSTGTAFSVRGDGANAPAVNGTINYSGTINKTSLGLLFEVNTLSGALTFNGPTLTGAFAGPGAVTATLANITGTFTANHLSLDSSESALANTVTLVSISGVNSGTMNFHHMVLSANGTTSQGAGLVASGGGTLNITNTGGNSSITTRNAIALSVNGMALAASSAINAITVAGGSNTVNAIAFTNVTGGTLTIGATSTITGATGATFLVSGGSASVTYNGTIAQANANPVVSITGHATGTFTFGGNVTGSVDGADLFFDNADGTYNFNATNAFTNGAGINVTNGSAGTFSFSSNTSVTNGLVDATDNACFRVDASAPNVTYSGNLTKNAAVTGRLVDIAGQTGGTITFQTGTLSATSTSGTSTGIGLDNADGTVNFNGTNTLNGGNAGVDIINGSAGTFAFSSNTAITNPSGAAFAVSGSSPSITYSGTITQNTAGQRAIDMTTLGGGTSTFSGTIGSSGGAGVSIEGTGGTITISGQLSLTGAASVFKACNGTCAVPSGTGLTIAVTNASNVVGSPTAATATGVTISNATIGASGVQFDTVNVSGGTNGILLSNTGNSGGFTINGTGAADSGGTIQNTTGDAISLNSVRSVTLNEMQLSNSGDNAIDATSITNGLTIDSVDIATTANSGIRGTTITDFKFQNSSTMTGAGNAANEYGIELTDITGPNNAVTNSSVTGSAVINLFVTNNTSTAGTLTISNSTLNNVAVATGGDGVSIVGNNSANLTVNLTGGNNLNNNQGDGIQVSANNSATVTVSVNGATSNYNANLGSAVNIAAADSATITATVSGFTGVSTGTSSANGLNVINIQNFNTSTINATVSGNTISGLGNNASGIRVIQESNGTINASLSGNNISGLQANGIVAQARAGSGQLNLTISGNTVNLASGFPLDGVSVESGSSAGTDTNTVCLNMLNNTSSASGQQGYRLRKRSIATFNLQNFSGTGSNPADITAWVNTTKSNTGTTDIVIDGGSFGTSSGCPTP